MNAISLLLALLVVAYIGSSLSLARGVRGYSLPSGVEYVLLGAALGPGALGVVDRTTLSSMIPIAVFALGWIALEHGSECGLVGARPVPIPRMIIGGLLGALLAAAIAAAVYAALGRMEIVSEDQRLLAAVGVALVSCESTRHALRWVAEHHAAQGPLSQLISDISSVDAAVPLLALAWWFGAQPIAHGSMLSELTPLPLMAVALGLGVVVGLLVAVLLQTTERSVDAWGVLLGGALIGVGVAYGARLSWMTALFAMGVTIALFREQRQSVHAKLDKTEHAVLLPVLALAGAHIDVRGLTALLPILPVAFIARVAVTVVVGGFARVVSSTAARGGAWLGPSMMSSGALTVCIGFACALNAPGTLGQLVLVAAVVDTLVGEVVGPIALRRALGRAGELNARALEPQNTPVTATTATSSSIETPP